MDRGEGWEVGVRGVCVCVCVLGVGVSYTLDWADQTEKLLGNHRPILRTRGT